MAPEDSRFCRSPCRNLLPDSTSSFPGLALSRNPTPAPAPVPAPISAPAATDELFKKFMRAYLETN